MRACLVEGCQRKHDARGYCKFHGNQYLPMPDNRRKSNYFGLGVR